MIVTTHLLIKQALFQNEIRPVLSFLYLESENNSIRVFELKKLIVKKLNSEHSEFCVVI